MHTKFKTIAYSLLIATTFTACSSQDEMESNNKPNPITFVSGVDKFATRISQDGGQWTAGDQIGIYMVESGKTNIMTPNVPHAAETSAQTTTFKPTGNAMLYPEDEAPVDFIAYYPYTANLTDMVFPVQIADQSASLIAHDLIYAQADNEGKGFTSGSVSFGFKHQLAKITVNLVDESDNALTPDANGVLIKGMNTTATFDLKTGTLANIATPADIIPFKNDKAYEAILLPTTITAGHEAEIIVNGNRYLWKMDSKYAGLEIKSGFAYTFKLTVKTSSAEIEAVLVDFNGNSITPWGDGGADNKEEDTKDPTEDIEIPADFEKIAVPTGGSIKEALANAASAKVAIVLADGGNYTESAGFSIPATITSLMLVGEGGITPPTVHIQSSITVGGNMDLIYVYNLNMSGVFASSYFINQSEAVTMGQITFDSCTLHDMRGIVRVQKGASKINSYQIINCIIYNINNYSLLAVEAGAAYNIEITKSTCYNLAGRGVNLNVDEASTVTIDQCTFNQGPLYAIAQFKKNTGGTLIFKNSIVGLPYNESRGVSVSSNAESTTVTDSYYVKDTNWNGNIPSNMIECEKTAKELFADPDNGDFTQSILTAGDPRWY